jgi:hypothetical protein
MKGRPGPQMLTSAQHKTGILFYTMIEQKKADNGT